MQIIAHIPLASSDVGELAVVTLLRLGRREASAHVWATVLIEWPLFCDYWQGNRSDRFLETMKFKFTDFDGCMYGLVAKNKGKESFPIRKPWRIAYFNSAIVSRLNRLCGGSHWHVLCHGSNALYSQGYTPLICEAIWMSLRDKKGQREERNTCMINVRIAVAFASKGLVAFLASPCVVSATTCFAVAARNDPA